MRFLITVMLLVTILDLPAQEYKNDELDISQLADNLYGLPDSNLNYEELYENLVQLYAEPLNLNTATAEDFRFINILTESQINALLNYRTECDPLLSVYEMQAIPEFDLPTIHKLAPFVTVSDQTNAVNISLIKRIKKESENYFLTRYERTLESKNGFSPRAAESTRFKGSPDKLYMRFRSSRPGDFSIGFIAEKDPGEQIRWNSNMRYYGADYLSYHVQLQNKGRLKNLILGDFQCQFGQGLMLGGMFGTGKGGETITSARRSNIGLVPYTSVNESGVMRGIGATVHVSRRWFVSGFYSNLGKDATVGISGEEDIISSFQLSGLHRNPNELAFRKASSEKNLGAVVSYKYQTLDAGIMFNQTVFEVPVHRNRTVYNQFAFQGRANQNAGFYLNYTIHNMSLFAEGAKSLEGGYAATAGILASLSPKLDIALLYRNYYKNFYPFYSSGFSESSNTHNERGLYWGWKYTFNRHYNVSGYVDFFRFPWLRFRLYAPSTGYEWLVRFNWDPSRKTRVFLQVREESKMRNVENENKNQYRIATGKKNNYCVNIDLSSHPMLRLKSRAQLSTYSIDRTTTSGFALMQDIIVDVGKLKFTMRYGIFESEDYDNRQYAYENDVWLAYSLPAYSGSGVRKMVILEYKITKQVACWIRFAQTRYRGQESIGTGVDRIEGDTKTDLKAQVVVRF